MHMLPYSALHSNTLHYITLQRHARARRAHPHVTIHYITIQTPNYIASTKLHCRGTSGRGVVMHMLPYTTCKHTTLSCITLHYENCITLHCHTLHYMVNTTLPCITLHDHALHSITLHTLHLSCITFHSITLQPHL